MRAVSRVSRYDATVRRLALASLAFAVLAIVAWDARLVVRAQSGTVRQTRPARGAAPAPAPPLPPSFAPTLDREAVRWVDATLKSLSDDQLVGQVLMGRLDSTYLSADSVKFEELAALVRGVHLAASARLAAWIWCRR